VWRSMLVVELACAAGPVAIPLTMNACSMTAAVVCLTAGNAINFIFVRLPVSILGSSPPRGG